MKIIGWIIFIGILLYYFLFINFPFLGPANCQDGTFKIINSFCSAPININNTNQLTPAEVPSLRDHLNFHGYPCTDDCSGHEAGYKWAEEKGIDNEEDCGGNSESFIEGCQIYVEENYHDITDDYNY